MIPTWVWMAIGAAINLVTYLGILMENRRKERERAKEDGVWSERRRQMWEDFKERKGINGYHGGEI